MRTKSNRPEKLVRVFLARLFLAFLLTACGDNPTPTPKPTPVPPLTGKVAIITSATVSSGGWESLILEVVLQTGKELNIKVDYFENVDTPAQEVAKLRELAGKGYELIFIHGAIAVGESVAAVAPEFPKVWFVEFDGEVTAPNSANVTLRYEEVGYLAGMAAAMASKTGKVGGVMGPDEPAENRFIEAIEQGVKAVNPNGEFLTTRQDWYDNAAAIASTNDLFDNKGVEVIIYDVSDSLHPTLNIAKEKGKMVISPNYDMYSVAPYTVLASTVYHPPLAYVAITRLWRDKKLESKTYTFGLKDKVLDLSPTRGKITKEQEALLEKTKADLISGKLTVKLSQ
jgi:basic membrane protein A and related proteins